MNKLTVAIATYNEEKNIGECLESIKELASEIIVVDGSSTDKTVEIAKKYSAKVIIKDNPPIFHINKQKAINNSTNNWVLQLDADERVSKELAEEIKKVINMTDQEAENYEEILKDKKLFLRHQRLLEERDGKIGVQKGPYVAFFVPRLNYFLGKYLKYGGVYPDGVIRLIDKRHAYLPCIDVHEQFSVNGRVGWLNNPLYHFDSPTFSRYLKRNNRYTDLMSNELMHKKKHFFTPVQYLFILPSKWFVLTYFRHKGILDGWPGLVFSFFSSLRFPIAYMKYVNKKSK